VVFQVEESICQERGDDTGDGIRDPEESKTDRQFPALVEITQIEHDVWDKAPFKDAQKTAGNIESGTATECVLTACHDTERINTISGF
jgi:hypothetical protein